MTGDFAFPVIQPTAGGVAPRQGLSIFPARLGEVYIFTVKG